MKSRQKGGEGGRRTRLTTTGLLFADARPGPLSPLTILIDRLAMAESQKDVGRALREIKQLLCKHPELARHVPDDITNPPRLIVDNSLKRG
jgi:hypothetical protein